MTARRPVAYVSLGAMVLVAIVQLPLLFASADSSFHAIFPAGARLAIAASIKLAALCAASFYAARCVTWWPRGERGRRPWRLMATGLAAFAAGQAILTSYQVVLDIEVPFPSLADALFIPGTALLAVGLLDFVLVYVGSGIPLVAPRVLARVAVLVSIAAVATGVASLAPVLMAAADPFEGVVTAAYPIFDLAALIPAAMMVRVGWALRGGRLFQAWLLTLGGVIATTAGDIGFGFFAMHGLSFFEPLIHVAFACGYVLLAWGMSVHAEVIGSPSSQQ